MKKIIICFVALLGLAGCSDQLTEGELANAVQPMNQVDDEYYYYVKAIPKSSITVERKLVKHYNKPEKEEDNR